MTEIERITKVIEWSGLSENAFAKRIGYSSGGSIYNKLNGDRGINIKFITKIANAFPEINKAWLLMEIGDMVKDKPGEIVEESTSNNYNNNLIMTNETLEELIATLNNQAKAILKLSAANEELSRKVPELKLGEGMGAEAI